MATITAPTYKAFGEILRARIDELVERQKNPDKYRPIPTGLRELDQIISGIPIPSYIVIAGPEKGAKTATLQHLAVMMSNANRGKVAVFSIEEMLWQWADRYLSSLTTVERNKIRDLTLTQEDFEEFEGIYDVMKDEDIMFTSEVITAQKIIEESVKNKFTIVGVDGVQLLQDFPNRPTKERLEQISRLFLEARNKHHITFLTTWQLNEEGTVHGTRQPGKDGDVSLKLGPVFDQAEKPVPGRIGLEITSSRISEKTSQVLELKFSGAHSRIGNLGKFDVNKGITAFEDPEPTRIPADPHYMQGEL